MEEDRFTRAKRAEETAGEGGWRPGVGQLVGLVIGAILLLAALILGVTTGIGMVVLVLLGLVVIVVLLALMRGGRKEAAGACPHCGAAFNFPSHMSEFNCPSCGKRVESRG
jgi:Flp pilus assembly protein TadB